MTRTSPPFTSWFSSTRTSSTKPPTFGRIGTMWPSTCALSVETWVRLQMYLRTPPATSRSSTAPRIIRTNRRRPPGAASAAGASGAIPGSGRAPRCFTSGSIVVAIVVSQSLVNCQQPRVTNPGRKLGVSLMQRPRRPHRPRQRHARRRGGEPRVDVAIARPQQRGLRVDHFDVAGHARGKPLARLRQLLLRQLQPLGGDGPLRLRRVEIEQRALHVRRHLLAQVVLAYGRFLRDRTLLGDAPLAPEPVEQRHAHLHLQIGRADRLGGGEAVHAVVAADV